LKHLFVWLHREDGTFARIGELATTDPATNGRFESEFEYAPEWVSNPSAFSLDPASLPLQPAGRRFRADQFNPPLSAFDDALPDDWGRRLLTQALKLDGRRPSPAEMLPKLRGQGTGALLFTEVPALEPTAETLGTADLSALLMAATKFERGTLPPGDAFRRLLEGSSRAGGARPKALVHDHRGEWLAKFPSNGDGPHDVVGLEATCMELARRAGLTVPASTLQTVGKRRVLLVRRFDVTSAGGRFHMVSMRTLCKERPGIFVTSYSDLARVLEKYSASPASDVAMLFRHMAFNAAIGNVDDHLKNFWMIAQGRVYRLAPAFDLVPDISERGEHTLSFQYSYDCPRRDQLLDVARAWSVPNALEILAEVVNAAGTFAATARELKVRPGPALNRVLADVRRRAALLA
jgi:serine/threonine-protein kinase HipA